LIHNRHRYIC